MAYGISADGELVRQFQRVCGFCGYMDMTTMTRTASKTLVKLFWGTDPNYTKYDLRPCEKKVFAKLTKNKKDFIQMDGPHVEAYLMEMAHEVTKLTREDPKMPRSHPYVTLCKSKMEEIARKTIIRGYHTELKAKTNNKDNGNKDDEKGEPYPFKKPEFPKNMKKLYDLRQGMPIVTVKQDHAD